MTTPANTSAPPDQPISGSVSESSNHANSAAKTGSNDRMRPTRAGAVNRCKYTCTSTAPAVANTAKYKSGHQLSARSKPTMPPSNTKAVTVATAATTPNCTHVSKTGSNVGAIRSTKTMCNANNTAHKRMKASPSCNWKPSDQSTDKSAKPTSATAKPRPANIGVRRLDNTAAMTATKTTLSAVIKPAFEAVVNCSPNVCVKYPPQRTKPR